MAAATDMIKLYKDLCASGVSDEQAMAGIGTLEKMISSVSDKMATKEDVNILALKIDALEKSFDIKLNASDSILRADFKSEFKGLYLRFNILIGLLTLIATPIVAYMVSAVFPKFFS